MASVLHGSARTTPRIRAELKAAQAPARLLASQYGLNVKTVGCLKDTHLLAHCYYFERDYSAAEATARRLIRKYPECSRPRVTLAASLGQLGRVDEARAALEAAIATSLPILTFMTSKGL